MNWEIYGADEDITSFVKDEHTHLLHDLCLLKNDLDEGPPSEETLQLLSKTLNELLEHKFIEEQALYPLVQTHIEKKKLS